jgi:hypothetical protein
MDLSVDGSLEAIATIPFNLGFLLLYHKRR